MKTDLHHNRARSGSALIVTAIVMVMVSSVLVGYLLVTQSEFTAGARSQNWNASMALTEAGVEDALSFINKYNGDVVRASQWSTSASAAEDGWTVNGCIYTMHRVVDENVGYYDVSIDNTISNAPVISSTGTAYLKLRAGAASPFYFAAIGMPAVSATVGRTVQVKAEFLALFPGAIITKENINFNGNNVRVDSFDSTTNAASFWIPAWRYGIYDYHKARANGDVMTDSSIVGAISVGQANIYGTVDTGPGGTASIGNNGYVGPLPQVGSGIQPGYSKDDMNMVFPDVILPTGAQYWPSVPANNIISSNGNYQTLGIYGNLTITAAEVNLYVNGSISLSGQSVINCSTNTSLVRIYVSGPQIDMHGNATINNQTMNAHRLAIYGLPTLTSIDFGGNAAFYGTVYAPEADFQFGGGGNDIYDYIGSLVANSCKLNGKAAFHYDESLKVSGPGIGYVPASWREVPVTSN